MAPKMVDGARDTNGERLWLVVNKFLWQNIISSARPKRKAPRRARPPGVVARRLDLAYRAAMRLSDTQRDLVAVVHNESDAKWANGTRSRRS